MTLTPGGRSGPARRATARPAVPRRGAVGRGTGPAGAGGPDPDGGTGRPDQPPAPAADAEPDRSAAPGSGPDDPAADGEPGGLAPVLAEDEALDLLRRGSIEIEGRLLDASNATLRAEITLHGFTAHCVYKPVRGERPLWDFPDGTLADREVAAYLLSADGGFGIVPPTVLRDGPFGRGMCQLWIEEERQAEPVLGYVPVSRVPPGWHRIAAARDERGRRYALAHADDPRLARMAVFDAVVNNADRKGGHVIPTVDGRLYGVDHGVCFHVDDKLRTVLWGWADEPLPEDVRELLTRLRVELGSRLDRRLAEHLSPAEVAAVGVRLERLLSTGCFPAPHGHWPAVPWPPV